MKMVVAYIRHEAFEPIRADLLEAGFPSLTITEVKGSGRQKAITEHYRGSELAVHLRPKLKLECVVETKDVERDQGGDPAGTPAPARSATGSCSSCPSRTRSASAPARRARKSSRPTNGEEARRQWRSRLRTSATRRGGRARPGGGGERRVRPLLVHGHLRPAEVVRGRPRGAGRGARGRHGLRRLVDHGLQPDRGVGHDRHARPEHVPDPALAHGRDPQGRPAVLRRAEARRRALRGRPALRDAPGARRAPRTWASTTTTSGRSWSSSCSSATSRPRCSTRAATST